MAQYLYVQPLLSVRCATDCSSDFGSIVLMAVLLRPLRHRRFLGDFTSAITDIAISSCVIVVVSCCATD